MNFTMSLKRVNIRTCWILLISWKATQSQSLTARAWSIHEVEHTRTYTCRRYKRSSRLSRLFQAHTYELAQRQRIDDRNYLPMLRSMKLMRTYTWSRTKSTSRERGRQPASKFTVIYLRYLSRPYVCTRDSQKTTLGLSFFYGYLFCSEALPRSMTGLRLIDRLLYERNVWIIPDPHCLLFMLLSFFAASLAHNTHDSVKIRMPTLTGFFERPSILLVYLFVQFTCVLCTAS